MSESTECSVGLEDTGASGKGKGGELPGDARSGVNALSDTCSDGGLVGIFAGDALSTGDFGTALRSRGKDNCDKTRVEALEL